MANDIYRGRDVELQVKVDGEWVDIGPVRLSSESEKELAQAFAQQVDDAISRNATQQILDDVKAFDVVILGGGSYKGRGATQLIGRENYGETHEIRQFERLPPPHKPPSPKGPRNRWGEL